MTNHQTGIAAEYLAAAYLLLGGYWPLWHRLRTPVGEIDWVLRTRRHIVFLEVKRRQGGIGPDTPVLNNQQQRLRRAAAWFLQAHPRYAALSPRVDVMVIAPRRWPVHIKNAL